MEFVDDVLREQPRVGADLTYATFRRVWKEKGARLIHLIPHLGQKAADAEDPRKLTKALFRTLTERLYHPNAAAVIAAAAAADAATAAPASAAGTAAAPAAAGADADTALSAKVWVLYALYTLYSTQVGDRRVRITLPEVMWPSVLALSKQLKALRVKDPFFVLRKMRTDQMFAFALDYPAGPEYSAAEPEPVPAVSASSSAPQRSATLALLQRMERDPLQDLSALSDTRAFREQWLAYARKSASLMGSGDGSAADDAANAARIDAELQPLNAMLQEHAALVKHTNAAVGRTAAAADAAAAANAKQAKAPAVGRQMLVARNDTLRSLAAASVFAPSATAAALLAGAGASQPQVPAAAAAASSSAAAAAAGAANGNGVSGTSGIGDSGYAGPPRAHATAAFATLAAASAASPASAGLTFRGPLSHLSALYTAAQYRVRSADEADSPTAAAVPPSRKRKTPGATAAASGRPGAAAAGAAAAAADG